MAKIESNGKKSRNANFSVIFLDPKYTLFMDKVQVFRKGRKKLKKYSTCYDRMSESQNKWETFSNFFSQYLNFKQSESLRKNRKRWICLVKLNPPIIFGPIRKNIVKLFVDNPSHELPYSVL